MQNDEFHCIYLCESVLSSVLKDFVFFREETRWASPAAKRGLVFSVLSVTPL